MKILQKTRSLPQGVKSSAALLTAQVVSMGISYITVPLFTRLLTTDEYGQVNVFLSWMSLFGIIAMFQLSAGIFNNGMVDYPDKRDEYSFSMLVLSNLITIGFSVVLFVLYPFIKDWIGLDWQLLALMCFVFLLQPAYSFWAARQRYEMKYKALLASSVITAVLTPAVALFCVTHMSGNRAYARIFGMQGSSLAIYIVFYILLVVRGGRKIETRYWKSALLFNLPLLPHYFSAYVLSSSDRLMISRMVSNSATAFYSIANSVASVATIIWSAVQASLIPFTYEHCKKKDYAPISKLMVPILTIIAGCCILVIMLAPEVVTVLSTPEYREAIYAIPPIVGGVFFQVHHGIYSCVVFYYKKPKFVMIATVISAVLNLILNLICISLFGFIAAGYTTMVSYLTQAAIDYWAMKKVTGGVDVYNMKHIGALSFGLIIIMLFSNIVYNFTLIRYAVIVLLFLLCFVLRKKILQAFGVLRSFE